MSGVHLITLDQAHAKANGTTEASKKLRLRIATQRDMDKAIARVKRKFFQPVTKLFDTTAQGKHEYTSQQEISTACIIENKKQFSQNFDTPPMCDALIDMIRYDAKKEGDTQILEGIFVSPMGTPKYMQKALDHLRKPQIVVNRGTILNIISTQEHIQGWKTQKERTSSYQGELNFNDFKAGSQDEYIA